MNMKKTAFYALGLMLVASCADDYDDSRLNSRLDGLEGLVTELDAKIKDLQKQVTSINETNEAFTALMGGGVITNVTETDDGIKLTVTNSAGSKDYELHNGKNGEKGEKGEKGDDGITPELKVVADEDGRLYWTLNGEPLTDENGEKVYATGEDGKDGNNGENGAPGVNGKDGVTPMLKVDRDADTPEDVQVYWWVSTDGKEESDPEKVWKKLTPITSIGGQPQGGFEVKYDRDKNQVVFTLEGKEYPFGIVSDFTVGKTEENRFYNGQTRKYECEITDGDGGYIVKASLQNEDGGFTVKVEGTTVSVTANKQGAKNIVDVELVKQDGTCKHHYFDVMADVTLASLDEVNAQILTGKETSSSVQSIGIRLDSEISEEVTLNVAVETDLPEGSYTIPETVKVSTTETQLSYTIDGTKLEVGKGYDLKVTLTSESASVSTGEKELAYNAVIGSEAKKLQLTAENYSSPFDGRSAENDPSGAYQEGGGVAALCDGLASPHFGSAYWPVDAFTTYAEEIREYGVWIDVTLTETVKHIQFRFQQRNGNGKVNDYKIGMEVDGSGMKYLGKGSADNIQGEGWNTTAFYPCPQGASQKARFGVTKSSMGDLTETPSNSMALLELEVYVLK